MFGLSATAYAWIKALHIIGVISWMAAMLYLPRLFVYHAGAEPGSQVSEALKVMEKRLLHFIMNPAATVAILFGSFLLAELDPDVWSSGWLPVKMIAVAGLMFVHILMILWWRAFSRDENQHTPTFFRYINEVPTVLMIVIVIMAVVKPF